MIRRLLIGILAAALAAVTIVWLGFRWRIEVPEAPPEASRLSRTTVIYDGLPSPLQYYLRQTASRTPPVTESAVLWGTARKRFRVGPLLVWLPMTWTLAIEQDSIATWSGEVTWFGVSIAAIRECVRSQDRCAFFRHQGMAFPALYAWTPSEFLDASRRSWERLDRWTIRLTDDEHADVVLKFDPRTRALTMMLGSGCLDGETDPVAWSIRFDEWGAPGGVAVPVAGRTIINGNEHYRFQVRGAAYNRDIGGWATGTEAFPPIEAMVAALAAPDTAAIRRPVEVGGGPADSAESAD